MRKETCSSLQLKIQIKESEAKFIFPHPYNGGVANDTETCQTKPEYNRATLLLGKNLVYKARFDDSYISVQGN